MGRTEEIERRAYELWEAEGKPDGVAAEHWCPTRKEVDSLPEANAEMRESANTEGHSTSAATP